MCERVYVCGYVCACMRASRRAIMHISACVRLRVSEVMMTGVATVSVVAQKTSKLSDI